jgi:hypothetical protein
VRAGDAKQRGRDANKRGSELNPQDTALRVIRASSVYVSIG